jgi:hypothetical protein
MVAQVIKYLSFGNMPLYFIYFFRFWPSLVCWDCNIRTSILLRCDGLQCFVSDIDECKTHPESCDNKTQKCNNIPGGFYCSCLKGYEDDGSGTKSCRAKVNQSKVISIALGKYLRLTLINCEPVLLGC